MDINDSDILITTTEEHMLDIMEVDAALTPEQLKAIDDDSELKEQCKDVMMTATALHKQRRDVDVEQQLATFHAHNDMRLHRRRSKIIMFSALAAAAAIVAFVVMLFTAKNNSDNTELLYAGMSTPQTISFPTTEGQVIDIDGNIPLVADNNIKKELNSILKIGEKPRMVTVKAPEGKSLELDLPDGSHVLMSPKSEICFPSSFRGSTREVAFQGYAYFDVSHREQQPFIVHMCDKVNLTVLGTEFFVEGIGGAPISVALVKGKVKVVTKKEQRILHPGEKLSCYFYGDTEFKKVDTAPYVSWKKGRFSFHNASLLEVLLAVCMYHTTPLRGNSKELEKVKVDFECNRSLPFNDVLKELERQCGVDLNYDLGVLNVELI